MVATASFAQKVVTTTKTGELSALIPAAERNNVPALTVVGPVNGEDLRVLREMTGRNYDGKKTEGTTKTLDLSKMLIKFESGKNYMQVKQGMAWRQLGPSADDKVGVRLFFDCRSLEKVILPETTVEIEAFAFFNAQELKEVTIPNSVAIIRNQAFASTKLTEVILPASLTTIESKAFDNCKELTKVVFTGTTAPKLPADLFNRCPKLAEIHVPAEALEAYKTALAGVATPESVTITNVKALTLSNSAQEVARFDLQGRRLSAPAKGINVVRYSNGTTAKVVVE